MKLLNQVILGISAVAMTTVAMASSSEHAHDSHHMQMVNSQANYKIVTVKQAKSLIDNSKVELKGTIVKAIGDEKYEFKDATGSITIEIDDEDLKGRKITNNIPVTILGEVDVEHKSMQRVKIDVDVVKF